MRMMNMLYLCRSPATVYHTSVAANKGCILYDVGPLNPFTLTVSDLLDLEEELSVDFDAVVVDHPASALRFSPHFLIGVFDYTEGDIPTPSSLHLYSSDIEHNEIVVREVDTNQLP